MKLNVISIRPGNPAAHWLPYLYSMAMIGVMTVFVLMMQEHELINIALFYQLPVILSAFWWGRWPSYVTALVSMLAFDFLFIPPTFTLSVDDVRYIWSFITFLLVAFVIGGRTEVLINEAATASQRERSMAAVMGRGVNRGQRLDPMVVTGVSMGIGAVVLLAGVAVFQGIPPLSPRTWLLLVLIAGLNTAFAFWVWNHTLRLLTAMESSMINNSMLVQITLLAWLFLGESISPLGLIGLVIAVVGLFLVNWQPAKRAE